MNKFVGKLYRFMYGRYGIDELYKVLLVVCVCLSLINLFLDNKFISVLEFVLLVIAIYRTMSRNVSLRRRENKRYLNVKNKLIKKFDLLKRKWNDRNTHIYRRCPKCRTVLRLPLRKGVHACKCPTCGNRFDVRCFRNEKVRVEVIKRK